jgi:RNase P subunit RPR2
MRAVIPMPSDRAITHTAFRYPAPICGGCDQPMLTITEVRNRRNGEPLKLITYRCAKCGSKVGKIQGRPKDS